MSATPKSLFQTLTKHLLRKRKVEPEAGPLGLSPTQLAGLETLYGSSSWRHWQAVLEVLLDQRVSRLVSGLPHDEYLKTSGETRLLIQLASLPDTITATERARHDRQQPEQRPTSHFLNTPWYGGAVAGPGNGTSVGGR
jgi:hypothetical protein